MKTYYDDNGCRIAVDHSVPVDVLEPEMEPTHDLGCDLLTVTELVAATYLTGEPEVNRMAWRFLLNKEPRSMRACARSIGFSATAISKRVYVLAQQFQLSVRKSKLRELRREVARRSWEKRKRRSKRKWRKLMALRIPEFDAAFRQSLGQQPRKKAAAALALAGQLAAGDPSAWKTVRAIKPRAATLRARVAGTYWMLFELGPEENTLRVIDLILSRDLDHWLLRSLADSHSCESPHRQGNGI